MNNSNSTTPFLTANQSIQLNPNLHTASKWEIDLAIHIMISGYEPVDAKPQQRSRCYIARCYENENYPPEEARQYITVPSYCEEPNCTIKMMTDFNINSNWDEGRDEWECYIASSDGKKRYRFLASKENIGTAIAKCVCAKLFIENSHETLK